MTSSEFEKLIIQQKDKMYRFAVSILKNSEDAQDTVQEVVLQLWKNRRSLDRKKNLESYCLNAVRNRCFDVLRKQKHRQEYQKTMDYQSMVESNIEYTDLVEKLKKEILKLPDQQRLSIELKDLQGLNYEEISTIMEQSITSIRASVSRGRKKLYEIFKEEIANV
ncbi:RNA polymerase sigma factor [uncultured Draconibacterium sp.]|uniref:RNA polymerase sigma factor n=1 Tax=uncultured Draconibacterium sp. TaxID=1573823 RepID=UPI003217BC9B